MRSCETDNHCVTAISRPIHSLSACGVSISTAMSIRRNPPAELHLCDGFRMHLVGPVCEPYCASIRPSRSQKGILRDASPTMGLDGTIQDPESDIRRHDFDHGNFGSRFLVANRIHHISRL